MARKFEAMCKQLDEDRAREKEKKAASSKVSVPATHSADNYIAASLPVRDSQLVIRSSSTHPLTQVTDSHVHPKKLSNPNSKEKKVLSHSLGDRRVPSRDENSLQEYASSSRQIDLPRIVLPEYLDKSDEEESKSNPSAATSEPIKLQNHNGTTIVLTPITEDELDTQDPESPPDYYYDRQLDNEFKPAPAAAKAEPKNLLKPIERKSSLPTAPTAQSNSRTTPPVLNDSAKTKQPEATSTSDTNLVFEMDDLDLHGSQASKSSSPTFPKRP